MNRSLTTITDRTGSLTAFHLLKKALSEGAEIYRDHLVGWQGGSRRHDAYWQDKYGFWSVLEESPPDNKQGPRRRFWNCFGLDDPKKRGMLTITVEINPPHEGLDRRLGGLFAQDEDGHVYVAHTGRVGGGRRGIGQEAFRQFSQESKWREVNFGPDLREALILGPIGAPGFIDQVAGFISQVADFKQQTAR